MNHQRIIMKNFAGTKPLITIIEQCEALGVAVDDFNFRIKGEDRICLGTATGQRPDGSPLVNAESNGSVLFNTFNGRFTGLTDKGVSFNSDFTTHEHEPWFQLLLSFFYVEKTEAGAEKPKATAVDMMLGGTAPLAKG